MCPLRVDGDADGTLYSASLLPKMDGEVTGGIGGITLIYLDDILVFSQEEQQHRADVQRVLQRFREKKMFVKLDKSEFAKQAIQFLGHVVAGGQLRVDEEKLNKLALWKSPLSTPKQVRQLMGFLSYYRAFVPNFATVTAPLTDLLRGKGKAIEWTAAITNEMLRGNPPPRRHSNVIGNSGT